MSVPESGRLQGPPLKQLYFNGAFFWYVAWRIVLLAAFSVGTIAYFFLAGMLFPEHVDALMEQAEIWERGGNIVTLAASLLLCILIAGRYELGFGKGALLFIAGTFVSSFYCIPLYVTAKSGDENASLGWMTGYLLLLLIYCGGCAFFMWRNYRALQADKLQRRAIRAFD